MFLVIAASAFAVWGLGWSPVYLLCGAAAAGIAWELLTTGRNRSRIGK